MELDVQEIFLGGDFNKILIMLVRSQITNAPEYGIQNLRDEIKTHKDVRAL